MNKKIMAIILFTALAACATKEPPFDAVTSFREAEESMKNADYEKARKRYQEIEEKSPDKSYDAVLMLRVADTYYGEEKYSEAAVEYQAFLNYHPAHKDAPYAQYQVAISSYKDLLTIDRDPSPAYTVIREMKKLQEKYPRSMYEGEAQRYIAIATEWIADYELYVARFYYRKGSYKAAAGRCEKLLIDYPGARAEKDALYYAGLAHEKLGEKDLARDRFNALAQKYPAMKSTAQAQLRKIDTL
ncbi:MAG TPA: outer membrane protein assembly factor BamD [Nitrospirota bacterium]|nr:outer membrane protein assembly factor BamD [Nitrospirota bacterium]